MKVISSGKWGNTEIYQFSLGLMTFLYGLKQIYAFSDNSFINWCNAFGQLIACLLLLLIILKHSFKTKWMKYIIVAGIILLFGFKNSHSTGLLRYFLLVLAARDIPYKSILKTLLSVFLTVYIFSCMLYVIGISDSGVVRRGGIALGFKHPNITSLIIVTMIFLWLSLREKYNYKSIIVIYITAIFLWNVTKTQVAVTCLILFPFLYVIIKKGRIKEKKLIKNFAQYSQLIVFCISILLVILYPLSIYDSFRVKIDQLFSYRPYLNFNNIMKYGVSLWGENVDIYDKTNYAYNYFGGFMSNQKFNTVDNAYILGLITLGVIPMLIMFLCFIAVVHRAWKNKNYILLTISVFFAVYAFIENGCNEAFYMFPYLYLLAFDNMQNQDSYSQRST